MFSRRELFKFLGIGLASNSLPDNLGSSNTVAERTEMTKDSVVRMYYDISDQGFRLVRDSEDILLQDGLAFHPILGEYLRLLRIHLDLVCIQPHEHFSEAKCADFES